jgi:hypothetical protein
MNHHRENNKYHSKTLSSLFPLEVLLTPQFIVFEILSLTI